MINELLAKGAENARTGKELAELLHVDIRSITAQIEKERREGFPICANQHGPNAGYFLPMNADELGSYCGRLEHRAKELYKTRQMLVNVLKQWQEAKTNGKE